MKVISVVKDIKQYFRKQLARPVKRIQKYELGVFIDSKITSRIL